MKRTVVGLAGGIAAVAFVLTSTGPAQATMEIQKQAKAAGFPAANCQYCHVDKLPKKGAATNNDRGKFLEAQKETQKAKAVDVTWLKDYVEKK